MTLSPTIRRRGFLLVLGLLLTASLWLLLPAPASAYVLEGKSWPKGRIPYYDASGHRLQVLKAVRAWNNSGARVRFVPVPRARAKLLIRRSNECLTAFGSVGYQSWGNQVVLPRWNRDCRGTPVLDPNAMTRTAAHELGHVLGLAHEFRRCAVMSYSKCVAANYEWRCRILEPDDVWGAVRRYGGVVRPRPRPKCDVYPGPPAPSPLSVTRGPAGSLPELRIVWNGLSTIPRWLQWANRGSEPSVMYQLAPPGQCVTGSPDVRTLKFANTDTLATGSEYRLQMPDDADLPAGQYCLSVWAMDGLGHLSDAPATLEITVA